MIMLLKLIWQWPIIPFDILNGYKEALYLWKGKILLHNMLAFFWPNLLFEMKICLVKYFQWSKILNH